MVQDNGSKEMIPLRPKPHHRPVAEQGRKYRSVVSQDIVFVFFFSLGLCCFLASSFYTVRIKDQNGLIFYSSRQQMDVSGFPVITCNNILKMFEH